MLASALPVPCCATLRSPLLLPAATRGRPYLCAAAASWCRSRLSPPRPQVIAEHLFHEGLFEIGQVFVEEAGVEEGEALKRPYASMHTVLQEVRCAVLRCAAMCGAPC